MTAPYVLPPIKYEPTGTTNHGRKVYEVTAGGFFSTSNGAVEVPVGYLTDLASIPSALFLLRPDDDRWDVSAIIHDVACRCARLNIRFMTYRIADRLLYDAMLLEGSPKWIALAFWTFVRAKHIMGID